MTIISKALAIAGLIMLPTYGVAQQDQLPKKHRLQLGVMTETRGLSLSYEYRPEAMNRLFGIKGFVGYGFDKVSGGTWHLSTHYAGSQGERLHIFFNGLKEYSLGVEGNILLGRRRNAFEAGVGFALDYFNMGVNYTSHHKKIGAYPSLQDLATTQASRLASHAYLRAGYRYTHSSGVTLSTGLNALLLQGPFTYFYADQFTVMPYLGIGFSF